MKGVFAYIGTFGGRKMTGGFSGGYTFGFNGQVRDNEVYGEGNAYDFGARIYDPRLGRFLSTDPLAGKFAYQSPYVYAANSPILFIDREGEDNIIYLVVLPSGKQKLNKTDWKKVEANANRNFRIMGLNTRVVIRPYTDFNADYIDPTDSYVLVGKPDEMRQFMTNADGSLKSKNYESLYKKIENWNGSANNPEESAVGEYDYRTGENAKLEPGIAINSEHIGSMAKECEISVEEMIGITIPHGGTHNTGIKVGAYHHPDGASANAGWVINFLTGKHTVSDYIEYRKIQRNLPQEIFHPDRNKEVRKAFKATFGNSFNQDYYEKNKANASKDNNK